MIQKAFESAADFVFLDCEDAVVTDTTEAEAPAFMDDWFGSIDEGNLSLTADGQAEFTDIATWREGDPLVDIDGDPRPNEEGASDFAGADVP